MFGQKNRHLIVILIVNSLLCFFYGYFITFNNLTFNNVLTVLFITLSFGVLFKSYFAVLHETDEKALIRFLLTLAFSVNFFIIIGTAVAAPKEALLWVVDSYDMHIPGSVRIMKALKGETSFDFIRTSIYDRTYIAHLFGSVFFLIFGVNHIASSLSLIIPKLICCYFIFKGSKEFLGLTHAKIATLLYIFLPTAIFYTTTFYKEASLQMLVAMIFYVIIRSFQNFKLAYLPALAVLFLFLGNERHYLVPCFAISAILFAMLSTSIKPYVKIGILLSCVAGYFVFTFYYWDIGIKNVVESLVIYKEKYSNYADVTSVNKTFPYPLLVIKFLFTPFFNSIKLNSYSHYATLITWGSIPYHLVAVLFCLGTFFIIQLKTHQRLIAILVSPFLIFLLIFGYVAPYNGRLRDSFLPLIVMVASYSLNLAINKFVPKALLKQK